MNETTSNTQETETLKIYPDTTHQTSLSRQAEEFRKSYQISNSLSREARARQHNLIVEEFKEFLEADGMLYLSGNNRKTDCLKELADLVYVCYQYAENMGWFLDEALDRVHQSNMSKLGKDGKPIYREDGKVLKGPDYEPPTLMDLI